MSTKQYYCYLLASRPKGTLYVGVTNDLIRRVYEHKNALIPGFTQKYCVHHLVWYEIFEDIAQAIRREKNIKAWKREWKIRLIEEQNPKWEDLYTNLVS